MDNQIAIIEAAKKEGLDPANLTPSQYTRLSLKIRTAVEIARDAGKVMGARTRNVLGRTVSLEQAKANESKCRSNECSRFRELVPRIKTKGPDGKEAVTLGEPVPACDACNCSGKNLIVKWSDPIGHCPLAYWSNMGKDDKGRNIVLHGDAQSAI